MQEKVKISIIYNISFYIDLKYNIEWPRFECENSVNYIENIINKLGGKIKDAKEHNDCIIYFIKSYGARTFLELEERMIQYIIG